jgi:hypothetical protein
MGVEMNLKNRRHPIIQMTTVVFFLPAYRRSDFLEYNVNSAKHKNDFSKC